MDHFEHSSGQVTFVEQDGFLLKLHVQITSDSGVDVRELLTRIEQISGHLRRVKCRDSISRGQLALARIEDSFYRVRSLSDDVDGAVPVKFIDYGHEDVLHLSDIIVVDPPLSDVLTTHRPLAEEFYLDGVLLLRPLTSEEIVTLSEKLLFRTVSCRYRRLHPDLSLIELATGQGAGERRELFANAVIDLGYGNKCTSEDIANYLRIKLPSRSEEVTMQQPARPFGATNPYSVPPPTVPMLTAQDVTMLSPQNSVNSRLMKYQKRSPAAGALFTGNATTPVYHAASSPPPLLADRLTDRKQYAVHDGRTCTTAPTLPVKTTHNAYISHVENGPYHFTIQLKSSVEELLPKLRNILIRYQNAPITAQLIPGSVVMAKSADETLRRGVIMNVQPDTCKVYFIDFGNSEELAYSSVFQLPNAAADLSPAMAIQFCLADLKSVKITDSNKDYFARLLLGKQVLIRVTERESNSPFQYCEILWEGRSVREILMNLNSPMQYSYQYPRGREAPVSVIYVDGPTQFFVQYRSELTVVNQIQEALASYCPSQPRVTDLSAINIGSPVASIFPEDQRWYRALVMGMESNIINVLFVDYGNRAEVNANQICLLNRDLVNKWKTQAIECCLIGFDTVTPDLFMTEKMEEAVLGRSYTLRLHSIISGFRLSVDLIDDQGNSVATNMKNILDERHKTLAPPFVEKKKPPSVHEDDKSSQHSSNSVRMPVGVYEPPPAKAQKSTKSGDGGGKKNIYQRPGTRGERERGNKFEQRGDRNKYEERPNAFSQHDDRAGNDYKPRNDSRSDWKKSAKKPYMDQDESDWGQEPKSFNKKDGSGDSGFKKSEWRVEDKSAHGGGDNRGSRFNSDRSGGGRGDYDRKGGSNRFERKPVGNEDEEKSGDRSDNWGSKDRKFGDRDTKFGGDRGNKFGDRDNKFSDRDNKFGDRDNKFGDRDNKFGDRDNKFGDRGNKFGDRENKFGDRDNKFGDRDNKFGDRDNKFGDRGNKFGDRGNKYGDRESKFGDRDSKFDDRRKFGDRDNKFGGSRDGRKPKWNGDSKAQNNYSSTAAAKQEEVWGDEEETPSLTKRPSQVISEYPYQAIKVGQEYKVLFAAMESSPSNVYVQMVGCEPMLDKIRDLIDKDVTATSRSISNPVLAMPVLARFNDDGLLYRATIKSIMKLPSGQVDVLFVDYGNAAVNPLSEVFTISSEVMSIPIQAIHVNVSDMPNDRQGMNLAACEAHFDTDLTLKPTQTITVNLEQVIVGTLICSDGVSVADRVKNDPSCVGGTQVQQADQSAPAKCAEDPTCVDVKLLDASVDLKASPKSSAVAWIESLELLRCQILLAKVVKKLEESLYSIKISATLDLVLPAQSRDPLTNDLIADMDVIVAVDDISDDRILVKYYNIEGQSLSQGSPICPVVSMPIVQRKGMYTISHKENETIYLQTEASTLLDDLLGRLFEEYDGDSSTASEIKTGDLCAAKSFDGNWYRGKVSNLVENMYTVNFIDYGNSEEVSSENVKPLGKEFMGPEMCVHVELPVKYTDLNGCFDLLGEDLIQCTFIKRNNIDNAWYVDLCDKGSYESVAQKWIAAGKAESIDEVPVNPKLREPGWNIKKGDSLSIVISHVDSPSVFWAQRDEQVHVIENVRSKIQDLPEGDNISSSDGIFVAKYAEDNVWYRAIKCGSEDHVRFLDYGNTDPALERRKLPENLKYPTKGYSMPLHLCARPVGTDWTEDAAALFDAFIEKDPKAEVVSLGFKTVVDLRSEDELLSSILINKGFAMYDMFERDDLGSIMIEDKTPLGEFAATVTAVTSVNDFYIQESSKDDILCMLAQRLESAESFKKVLETPSVGSFLAAKFVDDSNWYRAKVISTDPTEVLFLDYGNISSAEEFRVLPTDIAAFPLLAWHCTANFENSPENDEKFNNLVDAEVVFEAVFKGKQDNKHVVQLSVGGANIFDSSGVGTSQDVSTPSTSKAEIVEAPVKLIPPALTKSLYKSCILSHSNGPYDFYVQTDDDHIQIEEMENALFEAESFPKLDEVKKGDFIVAQFSDNDAYYRAIVTDVEPEVIVNFIDFGNSCPSSRFHELPSNLKEVPQLAVRCSLQSPIGGWSVDAIDEFTRTLNPETKSFDLKIISRGDPNIVDVDINGSSITKKLAHDAKFEQPNISELDSVSATDQGKSSIVSEKAQSSSTCYVIYAPNYDECFIQYDESTPDIDVITEHLSKINLSDESQVITEANVGDLVIAVHDEVLYRARVTKSKPYEVNFIDYGNSSPVDKLYKIPEPLKALKPLAVKVKLDLGKGVKLSDEGCVELLNLAGDGATVTPTGPSTVELSVGGSKLADLLKEHLVISEPDADTKQTSEAATKDPIPTPVASASLSDQTQKPSEFFEVTISHANSPTEFYYQTDSTQVDEIGSRLTDTSGLASVDKCEVGQLICAKYSEDGLWYRAKVIATDPSAEVFFIDFGNTSQVEEMKQLPDDLAKLPPLCVRASLSLKEQPWTEEEINKFIEIALGDGTFECSIVEKTSDSTIVNLKEAEIGDIFTRLIGSCSEDGEYCTPEILSVEDDTQAETCDESLVVNSIEIPNVAESNAEVVTVEASAEATACPIEANDLSPEVASEYVQQLTSGEVASKDVDVSSVASSAIEANEDVPSTLKTSEDDKSKKDLKVSGPPPHATSCAVEATEIYPEVTKTSDDLKKESVCLLPTSQDVSPVEIVEQNVSIECHAEEHVSTDMQSALADTKRSKTPEVDDVSEAQSASSKQCERHGSEEVEDEKDPSHSIVDDTTLPRSVEVVGQTTDPPVVSAGLSERKETEEVCPENITAHSPINITMSSPLNRVDVPAESEVRLLSRGDAPKSPNDGSSMLFKPVTISLGDTIFTSKLEGSDGLGLTSIEYCESKDASMVSLSNSQLADMSTASAISVSSAVTEESPPEDVKDTLEMVSTDSNKKLEKSDSIKDIPSNVIQGDTDTCDLLETVARDEVAPSKTAGVKTSTIPTKPEKASTTGLSVTRKKLPVKSLAEIKASAKSRISTGRSSSTSASKIKKLPQSSQSSTLTSSSPRPSQDDKIIPGAVTGHTLD